MAVETSVMKPSHLTTARVNRWRPWLVMTLIEIMAFCVRWIGFGRYAHLIYDEYYYVPAADVLLGRHSPVHLAHAVPGIDPNLLSHPPLAKELIALCILWFGNHPWAWRLPGEVLGILVPIGVYFIARALFRSELAGEMAALLAAFDGLMITISRVALPDSTAFPLVILNMLGLWLLVAHVRQGRPLRPTWWILWGISLGLGLAAKWIGAQTILAAWLFLAANQKLLRRQLSPRQWMLVILSVTWIPLGAYFLTYFYAFGSGFRQPWLPHNVFLAFGKLQWLMFKAMWSLTFYHPWSSNAWSWMLLPRPTAFLIISQAGHLIRVMAFSNPLVIWLGFLSLVVGTWRLGWAKRENLWAWIYLDIWWLAFYATWLLTPRSKFTYYLLSAMPAFILAVSALGTHLWTHRNRRAKIVAGGATGAVLVSTLYLLPLWVGLPMPDGFYHRLVWVPSWDAKPKPTHPAFAYTGPERLPLKSLNWGPATLPSETSPLASWTQFEVGPQHNVALGWSGHLPSGYAQHFPGAIVDQPAVMNSTLYFGTNGGQVVAWDLATKHAVWQDTVPNMTMTTPLIDQDNLIVGLGNNTFRSYSPQTGWVRGAGTNGLMDINRTTGKEMWFFATRGEDMPTPAIWRGTVLEVTGGGHLDAVSINTGRLLWQLTLSGFDSMSSPLLVGNTLYVATNVYRETYPAASSTLWAINLVTHQVLWSRNLPVKSGLSDCSPASNGQLVFIAGAPAITQTVANQSRISNEIFALNAKTGLVVWHESLGSGIMPIDVEEEGTPMALNGVVYIGSPAADQVTAFDAATGRKLWVRAVGAGVTASPLKLGSALVVLGSNGDLLTLDAKTGQIWHRVNLGIGSFGPQAPVGLGHSLIVSSLSGWIGVLPLARR